jgi:ATP-dependent DNA helicase RecG
MSLILHVNIRDLLHCSGVESARIEFKAGWDEKTTGRQVLKTICAFANDLQNLNGGYVVIGVEEQKGCAVMPPRGIAPETIDGIQRWITAC